MVLKIVFCAEYFKVRRFFHREILDHWFLLSINKLLPVTLKFRFLGEHYKPRREMP